MLQGTGRIIYGVCLFFVRKIVHFCAPKLFSLKELVPLRRELHKYPELSGQEVQTARKLTYFLERYHPARLIEGLGGHGMAALFSSEIDGPHVLFRCELDALPIQEQNEFAYCSEYPQKAHLCGHDGHMAIMAGLAPLISVTGLLRGKVTLLFQPAEETGQGAQAVLNDPRFKEIEPDFVFALHNLPGYPLHHIMVRNDAFCAASRGMQITLTGRTAHAANPQAGKNPMSAMIHIMETLQGLNHREELFDDFALVTVTHSQLGQPTYGTTPGNAIIQATLRSYNQKDMDALVAKAEQMVTTIAGSEELDCCITWHDVFPPTVNDPECVNTVCAAAQQKGFTTQHLKNPLPWSEDFGHFMKHYPGALFGIGAGNIPDLHQPDYDFPDELLPTGIHLFYTILRQFEMI